MKNLKSIFKLVFAMLFISAISFTSCGGKKEANSENDTEQAEGGAHPAAGDSAEHPTDN